MEKSTNKLDKSDRKTLWHSVMVLQNRESNSAFNGIGIYLIITVGLIVASIIMHNNLRFAERSLIFVTLQPLFMPIFIGLGLIAIYLAVLSSVSISRERDRGTLEVLLYGPVNEIVYLTSAFLAMLKIYGISLIIIFVWSNLVTWVLHLTFTMSLFWILLTSFGMAGAVIAFGILTAVWGGRTRTALIYFFLIVLLLAGIQVGDQIVTSVVATSGQGSSDSLLLLRNVFAALSNITQWISPYSQYSQTIEALSDGLWESVSLHLGILLVQCFGLLALSIVILKKIGGRG